MKGLHDYIIEIKEPFKESFKTESGLELYANKRFSADRLSNRIGKVIATPLFFEGVIEEGYEVLIDATILYEQIFNKKVQESIHLLDKDKMLYKIDPNLIVLYRENKDAEWKGFLRSLLVEPIKKEKEKLTSSLIILPDETDEFDKNKAKVTVCNDEILEMGVLKGDTIAIEDLGIPFWLDGKEYWWIKTEDILGKYE